MVTDLDRNEISKTCVLAGAGGLQINTFNTHKSHQVNRILRTQLPTTSCWPYD